MLTKLKTNVKSLRWFYLFFILLVAPSTTMAESSQPFSIPGTSIYTLKSEKLERSYDIYVKIPTDYDNPKNTNVTYPVIYLNDGPYTFQVASGSLHLPMGNSHKFERAILVGISFAKGEGGMASRVRDLTPHVDKTWKKYKTGGAQAYLNFIANEVTPFIENKFRADPTKRTLSGQSLGGSFGAWVLLTRPELFSNYILTSPSLWYKNRFIFNLEKTYAASHKDLKATVYFAVGEKETVTNGIRHPMVSQLEKFVTALKLRNYPNLKLKVDIIPGALHETTFPQGFIRGSHWIFGLD